MTYTPKILVFAGSTRRESFNKKLARVAADAARAAGAEVTFVDLAELPMPLYDGDLEAQSGVPANARKFKDLLLAHQGLLIASPEYNSSISGVLKNAIDWASRQEAGEPPLACFANKVAGLMSASPGALGGLRGLVTVRSILGNISVLVVTEQLAVSKAHEAFTPDGKLVDAKQQATVAKIAGRVVSMLAKLNAER
jgi:NAD(P)H-dependent FMN reductase